MNAITINPLHTENTAVELPVNVDGPAPSDFAPPATEAPTPAPEKVKLPQDEQLALDIENIDKQIEVLTKRREGKAQLLANLDALASIVPGTILTVKQGRADTIREVTGVVVGVREHQYKLSVGEGFDAEVIVAQAAQIVRVGS